jgi:hypothetical protein
MKVLANTAAFVAALLMMVGLIVAQRNYQNGWRDGSIVATASIDSPALAATAPSGHDNVVMK